MANRRFISDRLFQFETMPVLLSCNFIVDSTNGNGLGIRSLKGEGVAAVYMNTSSTPAVGSPNPAAGIIMVQLSDVYKRYLGGFSGQVAPLGASTTSTVAHVVNTISVLGTASLAQWQAAGLPVGLVPQLGLSFIPTAAVLIGGSAQTAIAAAAGSGINDIEAVGDPNTTVSSRLPLPAAQVQPVGQVVGGYLLLRCMQGTTLTAPAAGSVISLSLYLSNSSNTVNGQ